MSHWQDVSLKVIWTCTLVFVFTEGLTDNRCFLENGASSENFFVAEDLPVGSNIGAIRIHGDPSLGFSGTIALHLKEADSPVAINPGTKNLTLRRKLDKEGTEGPSSVFVNIICERLHSLDPGFVIPVNIRVTDANDNSPVFINAPYVLNISEVTVVGTRVLQGVHAIDNDQQGPYSSVRYSVLTGPHSNYFEFENELEGTLVLKKPLDYESLKFFDVHIRAQDHGDPPRKTDTVLTVYVIDADDQNPRFHDDRYTALLPNPPRKGTTLDIKPRDIKAFDQDQGINAPVYYTFNGIGTDYTFFKINRLTGKVSLSRDLNEHDMNYPVTLVIRATQQDNPDRYALATLTIDMNSSVGIKFLHGVFYIKASESLPPGSIIGTLTNNRPGQHLKYFVSDQSILKTFAINTKGEISLKQMLDYEEKDQYVFKVFTTDGITNDSSVVNISVTDTNEWSPRFRYPAYEFYAVGDPGGGGSGDLVGRVEAADGDRNDRLVLALEGRNASQFFVTPTGEIRLRKGGAHRGVANLVVVAKDSGDPPKTASVPVTVYFPSGDGKGATGTTAGRAGGGGTNSGGGSGPLLLAGLGAALLLLLFVVALLVAYICKVKRAPRHEELPTLPPTDSKPKAKVNPVFEPVAPRLRGLASAGGTHVTESTAKSRLPSPKVHPAPQPPPLWPTSAASRVKKLSWGDDKTDSDSTDNINHIDNSTNKLTDNTNLTVYF